MVDARTTQVQVPFGDAETIAGDSFVLEQSSRQADPGHAYVRVHPGSAGITFSNTSGTFTRSQAGLNKRVESYETFNDSYEVTLRYPNPRNVVVELLGRFVNSDGAVVTPTLTFDAARRTINSSIRGYGVIKVRYDAPYDIYLATFIQAGGGPRLINPYSSLIMTRDGYGFYAGHGTPDDDDDPNLTGYFPMTVIGSKASGETHTISPTATPDSDTSRYNGLSATDSKLPRLRIEIDPDYPPRLIQGPGDGTRLTARCGIRVFPAVGATVISTVGSVQPGSEPKSMYVKDSISFNGSPSASLQYQPAGAVDVTRLSGYFFDRWGRQFTPRIKLPGQTFTAVTWVNSYTFGGPVSREVGEDEIVICSGNNSIPCYGVLEVGYTVMFKRHMYDFEYDQNTKRFRTAFVAARYGEQFASQQVQPPAMRGVY